MENYWRLGKWAGIPVSLHWTVLLVFPWLFLMLDSVVAAAIGSVAFFGLLVAHEFGHAAIARWRGIYVEDITLYGMHGQTSVGLKRTPLDDVLIAWGGIAAQIVVLILALVASLLLAGTSSLLILTLAGPILLVLTKWNAFLMVVALLPIGPMDGGRAWKAIPMIREALSRKSSPKPSTRPSDPESKVVHLTPAKRRELEKKAQQAAADVIRDLGKKK